MDQINHSLKCNGSALLRAWRLQAGLSQPALAELLGTSQQQVSKYEQGIERPSLGRALRLAEITNATVPITAWVDEPR